MFHGDVRSIVNVVEGNVVGGNVDVGRCRWALMSLGDMSGAQFIPLLAIASRK